MKTVREIMRSDVITLRPETTMAEAVRLLVKHHIGGAPVVSETGKLEGIISELALIDVVFDATLRNAPVADHMALELQVVHPDEPLSRAAQLFTLYSFRRLPVVDNGKLVGIVSRRDLMHYSIESEDILTEPLFEMVPELGQLT